MTVKEIQAAILLGTFTDRELRAINGTIVTILKADRKKKVNEAKRNLKIGMEVKFGHQRGKIVKINRTKCVVDTGGIRGTWNVPMTMCQEV
tara:strand:- start:4396 stop:4668 length:273 start_codon:yes stop_codon:yes gene_type:complete